MEENSQQVTQTPPVEPQVETPAPEVPSGGNKKENKFSKKILAIFAVIALVLILGLGGAYATLGKSFMKPAPTPTLVPTATPIPTSTPTPTLALTPTKAVSNKVNPTSASAQSGSSSLTVKTADSSPASVTIRNQSTGAVTSGGTKTYKLPPGTYQVSAADKPGYRTGYSNCDGNCGSSWGNTTVVTIADNNPNTVTYFFIDQNYLPHCTGGTDSPTCF